MIDIDVRDLPAADRAAVPWKNGGGVTREILCHPEGADMADFGWRVSLAEVAADGPFSAFPGVDRTLTMAEGDGMELTVAGRPTLVDTRYAPRDFPGDAPTDCRLLGAGNVVNFNVMWRRDALAEPPSVAVVHGRLTLAPGRALVVALGVEGARVAGRELGRYDAVLVDGAATPLHATGATAVVTVPTAVTDRSA
ncbi:HutD family protein [Streptomyces sp. VRA16 Mangrove soil]|uniref:HutD/Ves family protein n=1 Tax=Streptomyces sp. VRA16 Mangrove soil TaxID=2817434 RepID=UPI001A9EF4DE|nr:HutD family protein [Streptomyces sp. VRA16 Mangrove soil]MBO1333486.1 HutD family protein [Streptomyces sp. VRA16 Mangrove soil]